MRDWTEIEGSSVVYQMSAGASGGERASYAQPSPPVEEREKIQPAVRREIGAKSQDDASREVLSATARERILSRPGEPLFFADWVRTLMIHFEVEARALQKVVPFELDLRDGQAFVSVVAFTLSKMRPRFGGRIASWLLKPIATHDFLNLRTYVRLNEETGIYFLAEWLSNRLSVMLGPRGFGLPYRFGKIEYNHNWQSASTSSSDYSATPSFKFRKVVDGPCTLTGRVTDPKTRNAFAYNFALNPEVNFRQCEHGSVCEWLMERYTAFTSFGDRRRFFRVWHQPWSQAPVEVCLTEKSLLDDNWSFLQDARLAGANFSPGVFDVWMGWPHRARG
jgi:uncharacterized protein YqjF (DUF2071 family)